MREKDTASISISEEQRYLLVPLAADPDSETGTQHESKPPKDYYSIGYLMYFTLGTGYVLPWNAFITAVDYFSYLYPGVPVDRVFSVSFLFAGLIPLLFIVMWAHKSNASIRINSGLCLFTLTLIIVPVTDAVYIKGRQRMYAVYDVTVAATVLCGLANALVQGGVIGSAGELPERYMQATVAGTAASGVFVSVLRVLTKAVYPQDQVGLRKSAILYFIVSIVFMAICIVCYNVADKLPVVQHYKNIKLQAVKEDIDKNKMVGTAWRSTLWSTIGRVKWFCFGNFLIYMVTLSIFPGYITENVHSEALMDWYPIILIASYNIFDLVGKVLPAYYLLGNANIVVGGCVARLLFYPLFFVCLHGPKFLRTEVPVTILTCLLGLTHGYLAGVIMILAPKAVPIQHAETTSIAMVLFLVIGLAFGSLVSWFWVI